MTLDQAREHVGDWVVYTPGGGGKTETGVIERVGQTYVYVDYTGVGAVKATAPEDLSLRKPR